MERYVATQFYRVDSPESRILRESGMVPSEFVLAADAQATIAALQVQCELWKERAEAHEEDHLIINGLKEQVEALQAQHKYLCRFVWGEEGTFTFPDGDTIEIRKGQSREQLEQQLTQRTAELHETQNHLADADNEVEQLRKQLSERTAELEAANKHCEIIEKRKAEAYKEVEIQLLDKADLQAELERVREELADERTAYKALSEQYNRLDLEHSDLCTLLLALPKVEGEIRVGKTVDDCWFIDNQDAGGLRGRYKDDGPKYAALLQHRQGMEGVNES